ncbi:MAG: InlB B-repeat-containing protein [Clostridia bacterium]|nr:InlB B-repeat-containing protein [Clostridia bacterium]
MADMNLDVVCEHCAASGEILPTVPVASVTTGDTTTEYFSFEEAIKAAEASEGSTLTLLDDIEDTYTIDSGDFTIDLNGKTIDILDVQDGNLTITDSSDDANGSIGVKVSGEGSVTIIGGFIDSIEAEDDSSVIITGGTFSDQPNRKYVEEGYTAVEIEDGKWVILRNYTISVTDNDGNALAGADMQIINSNDKVVVKWTSANESHTVGGLLPGSYKLHVASAPEGYEIPTDVKFVVDKDGGSLTITLETKQYEVEIKTTDGGTIKTDNETPIMGDKVTITVAPDTGKEVEKVVVKDENGSEIPVTENDDGTYTYEQPAGDVTITVEFKLIQYTITFVNDDGTELQSTNVAYGETPVYTGETPTKAATAQYTYTFAGWTPEITAVTGEATYTATYSETVNEYTVKFIDSNNTVIAEQSIAYGSAATAPEAPNLTGYTFTGWDTEFDNITDHLEVKAQYKINQYTIKFNTDGGTAVEAITQDYNTAVTALANPTKTGYTFTGWRTEDGKDFMFADYKMGAENFTLTAKWNPADGTQYTVNHYFQNIENDGYTVDSETKSGVTDADTAAEAKTVVGFTAGAVTQKQIAPDGSTVIDIHYTRNVHTLTFKPDNGDEAIISTVKFGAEISTPNTPTKTGYTFQRLGRNRRNNA